MGNDLRLECIAIGSMPHNNLIKAFSKVRECYSKIPFWPQMVKLSKNEDMILQYTEGMPSFFTDKSYLDVEYDEFYDDLERICTERIELSPNGPIVALNIPAGQWHTVQALESGTVILECLCCAPHKASYVA